MMKAGDVLEDGSVVAHVTPKIDENCDHDWVEDEEGNPAWCSKCKLSFTRYIFCCCP